MSQEKIVYAKLRNLLLDGTFARGERLVEKHLCDLLAVSRTPVRAALARLAAQNLVTGADNRGYTVRGITVGDVWDANVVRAVLEGTAAREAATRKLDENHREALEHSLGLYAALADNIEATDAFLDRHARANRLFHDTLIAAAGNASLTHAMASLAYMPVQINRSVFFTDLAYAAETVRSGLAEHRGVLAAVLAGDAVVAEMLMRTHSQKALRGIERICGQAHIWPDIRNTPFHQFIGANTRPVTPLDRLEDTCPKLP